MSAREQFIDDYHSGRLVFFTGAGVSRDSGAVMPPQILKASADLFLPAGRHHAADVDEVLHGKGATGSRRSWVIRRRRGQMDRFQSYKPL